MLFANAFVVSAATHQWIQERVQDVSYLIQSTPLQTMMLLDTVDTQVAEHPFITEITQTEMPLLVEQWYIEEHSAKRVKVREIRNDEITRLTFTTPRGNEQAEHRYRRVMLKQKHLEHFAKAGALSGDVLKIKSKYEGQEDKYILLNA